MFHYLYIIINNINHKFYYGIHSTNNINDGYFGSGKRLRAAIKKYGKENFSKYILEYFNDRKSLLNREQEIITKEFLLSDECYNMTYGGSAGQLFYIPVIDKNGNKLSVTKDDPRYLSGELIHHLNNYVTVKDKEGNTYSVTKDDPRYLSGELIHHLNNYVTVKDKEGNTYSVSKYDPRYLSGELVGICKNTISVKDCNDNKFRVSKDDPRYLSGELVGIATNSGMKNKLVVLDNYGNRIVIDNKDPRYLSGELKVISKNTKWINNGIQEKMINISDFDIYINNGWNKGRLKQKSKL